MMLFLLLLKLSWFVDAACLHRFDSTPGNLLASSNRLRPFTSSSMLEATSRRGFNSHATVPTASGSNHALVAFSLRGGASGPSSTDEKSPKHQEEAQLQQQRQRIKNVILLATSSLAVYGLFVSRKAWMGILFDKGKLQAKTLEILHGLNELPKVYSYVSYIVGMALWEALGLSTIPVETAAGMVFGWTGFILSGVGKLSGASLAFGLARYGVLAAWIQARLSTNGFLQLVQASTEENPLLVACLLKCSCFPETIKNYGSALLKPIKLWMFILGSVLHGWTFTALWTYLGVDTAARLGDATNAIPPDRLLQILLTLALINGIVVSPLAMALWVRKLRDHSSPSSPYSDVKGGV
jgi:uncharacterized membrane protein YdjX (TVP38/TMEM64 family)